MDYARSADGSGVLLSVEGQWVLKEWIDLGKDALVGHQPPWFVTSGRVQSCNKSVSELNHLFSLTLLPLTFSSQPLARSNSRLSLSKDPRGDVFVTLVNNRECVSVYFT